LDSSIASSSSVFAVHALSSGSTVFLSGKDIALYLRHLETDDVKVQEVDFQALKTESGAPGAAAETSKSAVKEKEDAKIEGAVQIAIGVKKEVDFAAWYTNVSRFYFCQSDQNRCCFSFRF
jgi:prolyl-tRNA synthetase